MRKLRDHSEVLRLCAQLHRASSQQSSDSPATDVLSPQTDDSVLSLVPLLLPASNKKTKTQDDPDKVYQKHSSDVQLLLD